LPPPAARETTGYEPITTPETTGYEPITTPETTGYEPITTPETTGYEPVIVSRATAASEPRGNNFFFNLASSCHAIIVSERERETTAYEPF